MKVRVFSGRESGAYSLQPPGTVRIYRVGQHPRCERVTSDARRSYDRLLYVKVVIRRIFLFTYLKAHLFIPTADGNMTGVAGYGPRACASRT